MSTSGAAIHREQTEGCRNYKKMSECGDNPNRNTTVTLINERVDLHPAPGRSLGSGSGCAHAPAAFSGVRVWQIEDTWLSSLCKPTSRRSAGGASAFESDKSGTCRRGLCALIRGGRTDVLVGMCLGMMVSVR